MPRVRAIEPIQFNGVRYEPGAEVSLPDDSLPQLLSLKAVELIAEVARTVPAENVEADDQKASKRGRPRG